jgi:hypothetical protein
MSVVVGVLTIDLKANTASFSQSMDKMSSLSAKTANDIKRSLEKIALAGVAMAGALATGTVAMIKGALDSADAMGKMAQAAGTTVESLTMLNYAAKLSNVETEQLVKGLEKLSVSAFKAQNGNVQLERIFGKLGVTTTDATGKLKDSGVLMEQVAVKFAKMGDSSGKTALAISLFGKAGATLIPMLNQYGSEQEKVNDEAHRFGLVLSTSTVEVAMRAHDNLDRLGLALKGIGFSVLSATLPALDALLEKLISLAKNADLQGLAAAFGQKVTGAVNLLSDALGFAVEHAHALKIALEALAGMKIAAIAIPVIGDLAGGGIEKVGSGLSKLVISGLGLAKVLPVLAKFGAWLKYTASFVGLLAAEEGIGAAATYVFGGALATIGGPITMAIAALVGLGVAIYKFRDATFSLNGTTYKLRDTWNAAWIAMGWGLSWVGKQFSSLIGMLKSLWSGMIGFFANSSIVKVISGAFGAAFEWIQGMLGKLTPQWVTKALDEAKKQRVSKETPAPVLKGAPKPPPGLSAPDTSGLGKQTESPVGKVLANLQEKLDESKQTLAAAGLEEEAQRKVAAANKASNEIMKLGEEIAKQTGAKTKDYASLVDEATQAIIRQKNAEISDVDVKAQLLNVLGNGSRAIALSISQSALMANAMDKGSDAVMRQTAANAALLELQKFGVDEKRDAARAEDLYSEAVAKESLAIHGNIISMEQELAVRRIVNDATLGSLAAQDEAALKAKLYALDVQIAGAAAGELRDKLLAQRAALVALNEEEKRASDLQNARALKSPAEQYALEQEKLVAAVEALRNMQNGTISYGQSLQIAMKEQENFNQLIDGTVKALLLEGSAASGVKAFFLDMQKQAITAGQIIYDALHQAFTKLSENLTQLVTGGKTSFAQMFQDIGKQMVNSTIQSAMQKGLGALGKAFPSLSGPLGQLSNAMKGKPDGTQNNPLWVQMASGGGMGGSGGGSTGNPLSVMLGGLGGKLGVGGGVMGTGVTAISGGQGDTRGDAGGLAVRDLTDLLGGWKPGDGEGGDDTSGGTGRRILPMPDGFVGENDGGGSGGSGSGGAGLSAITGMIGSLVNLFSGSNKNSTASKTFTFLGSLVSSFSGLIPHADGGPISGPGTGTSDSIPARLSNGEFVVRAAPAAKFKGLLQHINKGGNVHKTQGFASGGWAGYADGGTVTAPSSAYTMGETTSTMAAASGQIAGSTAARRGQGSTGPNLYYTIDARGTDPVLTEQRTRTAILAAHNSAVSLGVQVSADRLKRTPQR